MSGVRRDHRALDVCTGTGEVALAFARRCHDATGIDLSPAMLAIAREKDGQGLVHFVQMDATRLGFADGEFDVSAISFALHDVDSEVREEILREVRSVTRDRIVIVDYHPPANRLLPPASCSPSTSASSRSGSRNPSSISPDAT